MALSTLDELMNHLAQFEPTGFPVISLYLNAEADQHGQTNFGPFVRKELGEQVKTFPKGSAERESFEKDAERIGTFLEKEVAPQANGIALFACEAADLFEAAQLGAPIPNNRLFVYEQPHLYPLARLMDQYPRYVALVANSNTARLLVFGRGKALGAEEVQGKKVNRVKVGGWSQMRYQRRLANNHLQHAKEVVETLARLVEEERAAHVILAGETSILPVLREQMPAELSDKVIDTLKLDVNAPEQEILAYTTEALQEHDAQTDAEKVRRMFEQYRAGGLAVTGVVPTLTALYSGQADELLIDAAPANLRFNEQGVRAAVRPYDEDAAAGLDFGDPRVVADELVRRAQATDAGITFVEDSSLLEEVGGAGALLRYRV
jgi:peptide subunit release factor 1 (eRF1)